VQVLADNGGYVLAEEGSRLLFFKRGILPTWALFVPGLLAVIGVANAVLLVATGNAAAGGILLIIGALAAAAAYAVRQSRRRARATPLAPDEAVVVLDLAARQRSDRVRHGSYVSLRNRVTTIVTRMQQPAIVN
jgi:hypothetical protein